jgi:hypothetical protein
VEAITNSEMFERVARRELTPADAAAQMLEADAEARKQKVAAARPTWVPRVAWGVASVLIVCLIDALQKRS